MVASGLRSIRYALEVPLAQNIVANDLPSFTLDPSMLLPFGQRRCMMLTLSEGCWQIKVKISKGLLIELKDF